MELLARVSVRRHLLGDEPAHEPPPPLTVFRLLGGSPESALRLLRRTVGDGARTTIALAVDTPALSPNQRRVYEAIVDACRREARKVIVCGGGDEIAAGTDRPGRGGERWYPSVQHLLCASIPQTGGGATPRGRPTPARTAAPPGNKASATR
ncbi:MAG TPA: hypothetical protein VFY24_00495 [Azospira sp.]|nr:hypothetical protein [Azospira sp.]